MARKENSVKGLKLNKVNIVILACTLLLCAGTFYTSHTLSRKYKAYLVASDVFYTCREASSEFRNGSDYLTTMAVFFLSTRNVEYLEKYFDEIKNTQRRQCALLEIQKYSEDDYVLENFRTAMAESDELAAYEMYAMKLMTETSVYKKSGQSVPLQMERIVLTQEDMALDDEEKINKANKFIFDSGYHDLKKMIEEHNRLAFSNLLSETAGHRLNSYFELKQLLRNEKALLISISLLNILSYILVAFLLVKPLRSVIGKISKGERLDSLGSYEFRYLVETYNKLQDKNRLNEDLLKYEAEHDSLTGVINRTAFAHISRQLEYSADQIGLVLVDIDKFKQINDTCGHSAGDEVLKRVANVISDSFRTSDYVCRIGGDEFTVIIDNPGYGAERWICAKIDAINEELSQECRNVPPVSISAGIAISEKGFTRELFNDADKALYQVKRNGRKGCAVYDHQKDEFINSNHIDEEQ